MRRLLVLLPLLGGCLAPWGPGDPDVVLFGDSNSRFAQEAARPLWEDVSVSFNAEPGAQLDYWFEEMAEAPGGSTVVVALGANDILKNRTADAVADVQHAAELLAGHCVVWVTPAQLSFDLLGWPYDERAHAVIGEIRGQAHYKDWSVVVLPEWLDAGHVHMTETGYLAYAAELVHAKELCDA